MERIVTSHARPRVLVVDVTDSLDSVSVPQVCLDQVVTCHVPPTPGDLIVDMSAPARRDILMDVIQRYATCNLHNAASKGTHYVNI